MVTDPEILEVLVCVNRSVGAEPQPDESWMFTGLNWEAEKTGAVLSEARRRLLIWGWKSFSHGAWHTHLEVTVQGERLLRAAQS